MARYVSIIADIHGNLEAMDAVINSLKINKGYKGMIFAGDLIDYGVNPNECADYMLNKIIPCKYNNKIVGVLGNHDIAILNQDYSNFRTEHGKKSALWSATYINNKTKNYLNTEFTNRYENILVCHGNDIDPWKNIFSDSYDEMDYMILRNPDIEVFIIAHSHLQFETTYKGRKFINPGSVGQSRNCVPKAHYAYLDLDTKEVKFKQVKYDIKSQANKIRNEKLDIFLSQRLFLGI